MRVSIAGLGEQALRRLLQLIDHPGTDDMQRQTLVPELVVRDSSMPRS
jgi:LacI family transcriptional regulator